jgi:8-oxo-dGTP pyrophosphatase MutT (NUDIX family)
MAAEPQKFHVGVIDLFSVLLPGAVMVYAIKDQAGPWLIGPAYSSLPQAEAWAVFLVGSYLVGHFVFLAGAWGLDDIYDRIRNSTPRGTVRALARGKRFPRAWSRRAARLLFRKETDRAVLLVVRIKEARLGPAGADAVNAYQWSKARLQLEHPEALAAVQRFEADSKFFRSLQVVLVLIAAGAVWDRPGVVLAMMPLLVLAFWRYVDQRHKATNQAYWFVITEQAGAEGGLPGPPPTGDWTHAGGVVHRWNGSSREYLLVSARRQPGEWVLPKGHIEDEESPAETAVREVLEEAGVWARVGRELSGMTFAVDGRPVRVLFHEMEFVSAERRRESRKIAWCTLDEALRRATHEDTRRLLAMAGQAGAERV